MAGMSGSSAPYYGIALLQTLHALGPGETHVVLSDGARRTIQLEADLDPEVVCSLADVVHQPNIWPRRFRRAHVRSTARSQVAHLTSYSVRALQMAAR
jgi:3-polyprenyl-4-hydroxybenzoate decarboxylase